MEKLNILKRGRLLGGWLWDNFALLFALMTVAQENCAEGHKYKILAKPRFSVRCKITGRI